MVSIIISLKVLKTVFFIGVCFCQIVEKDQESPANCQLIKFGNGIEFNCPNALSVLYTIHETYTVIFTCRDHNLISGFPKLIGTEFIGGRSILKFKFVNCSMIKQVFMNFWKAQNVNPGQVEVSIEGDKDNDSVLHLENNEFMDFDIHTLFITDISVQAFPEHLFPNGLNALLIGNTNLTLLPESIFHNTENLTDLILVDNLLESIPRGCFRNLKKLTSLLLSGNQLKYLHEHTFEDLQALKQLSLDNNNLQLLPGNIFKSLINLQKLVLSGNNFVTVGEPLSPLVNLQLLHLSSCSLGDSDIDRLQHMTKLQILDVSHNVLRNASLTTSKNIFQRHPSLRRLTMTNCSIDSISSDFVGTAFRLQFLDISANLIQTVPNETTLLHIHWNQRKYYTLHIINLSHNLLTTIHPETFQNMSSKVFTINLSFNKLEFLHPNVFRGTTFMSVSSFPFDVRKNQLALNNNLLHKIDPGTLENLSGLQGIDLSYNRISSLDDHMFNGTHDVVFLNLSHNRLNHISRAFMTLGKLQILDLSHNEMVSLDAYIYFNKSLLKELYLSNNKLEMDSIVKGMNNLVALKRIDLSNNNITSLSARTFLFFDNLVYLNIANNNIARFEELWQSPSYTFTRYNYIFPYLQHWDLSNNSIAFVPSFWRMNLTRLNYLNLANNQIKDFSSYELRYASYNLTVDMQSNQIDSVDLKSDELQSGKGEFNSSVVVNLNDNPYLCTCDIFVLLMLQDRDIHLSNKEDNVATIKADRLKCSEPDVLRDEYLEGIEDWTPEILSLLGMCLLT